LVGSVSALAGFGLIDAIEAVSSMDRAAVMPPNNVTEAWRNTVRRVEGADGAVSSTGLSLANKWMDVRE